MQSSITKTQFPLRELFGITAAFAFVFFVATGNSSTVQFVGTFVSKSDLVDVPLFDQRLKTKLSDLEFAKADRPPWANFAAVADDQWFIGTVNEERIYVLVRETESEYYIQVVDHDERFWIWQHGSRHTVARKFKVELGEVVTGLTSP